MKNKQLYIGIFSLLLWWNSSITATAQTNDHFTDFCHWMTGIWQGDGFGGTSEEVWSPLYKGEMVGTYRHFNQKHQLTFYEFFRLSKKGLHLKHFSPDFKGWESKEKFVTFVFEKATANSLAFRGIKYLKKDKNTLVVIVKMQQKGKVVTEKFTFKRKVRL